MTIIYNAGYVAEIKRILFMRRWRKAKSSPETKMERHISDNWEQTSIDLPVFNAEGMMILMKDVRAYRHKTDGEIIISLEALKDAMEEAGIYEE